MSTWIQRNLAPISFFSLVIFAVVSISISNNSNLNAAKLLISQKDKTVKAIDRSDNFLLSRYSTKTDNYKIFLEDTKATIKDLESVKNEISLSPNDEYSTALRQDITKTLDFKIEQYQKISFDVESYLYIYDDLKNIGQFKNAVLNPDKIDREMRLEILSKVSESGKNIVKFYEEKQKPDPKFLDKIKIDTALFTKAYDSLKENPEITPEVTNEIMLNFAGNSPENEQWPSSELDDLTITESELGINDSQKLIQQLEEDVTEVKSEYQIN